MPGSHFCLAIGDLLREPGRRRSVDVAGLVDWALDLARIDAETPVSAELTLEGTSGGVFAKGRAEAVVRYTCNRCLVEWCESVVVNVAELLGGDGDYPLDGDEVDLEVPLRDAVVLALPLLPLCRPDCRGLCTTCGADLNTGSCPGHDDEPASPFAALRHLLEP